MKSLPVKQVKDVIENTKGYWLRGGRAPVLVDIVLWEESHILVYPDTSPSAWSPVSQRYVRTLASGNELFISLEDYKELFNNDAS